MSKEAVRFVNRLGYIDTESVRILTGAFVRSPLQLLSVSVRRGNAEICCHSGLVISRGQACVKKLVSQCR